MVLKATANDRRHLALCHDEFRGPRSGLYRSGGISNNNNVSCRHILQVALKNNKMAIGDEPPNSEPQRKTQDDTPSSKLPQPVPRQASVPRHRET
ncbi:hypothetical protein TNCV_4060901 [Trichonephila clavipes]|nr:hypothetical protein TNCV_4060901 [Trichonephila clavipes]